MVNILVYIIQLNSQNMTNCHVSYHYSHNFIQHQTDRVYTYLCDSLLCSLKTFTWSQAANAHSCSVWHVSPLLDLINEEEQLTIAHLVRICYNMTINSASTQSPDLRALNMLMQNNMPHYVSKTKWNGNLCSFGKQLLLFQECGLYEQLPLQRKIRALI